MTGKNGSGMRVEMRSTDELKPMFKKKLREGWMFLFGESNARIAVEEQWYSGDKNADFEVMIISSKKGMLPLTIIKREYFPWGKSDHPETIRAAEITLHGNGVLVHTLESTDAGIDNFVDELLDPFIGESLEVR